MSIDWRVRDGKAFYGFYGVAFPELLTLSL